MTSSKELGEEGKKREKKKKRLNNSTKQGCTRNLREKGLKPPQYNKQINYIYTSIETCRAYGAHLYLFYKLNQKEKKKP